MFAKTLTSGKLIITYAAAAADPTLITGGAATLETLQTAYQTLLARNSDIGKLTGEMEKAFAKRLKKLTKPDDAEAIMPQMLEEASGQIGQLENALEPEDILKAMRDQLTSTDYNHAHHSTFRTLMRPLLEDLCSDPRLFAALDPAIQRKNLAFQKKQARDLEHNTRVSEETRANVDAIMKHLQMGGAAETLKGLAMPDLLELARRFQIEEANETDPHTLLRALEQKADHYAALLNELEELKTRQPRLENMLGEARAFLEGRQIDTEAARRMIRNARETLASGTLLDQLEQDAEMAELEAEIATFESRYSDAADIYRRVAQSFASAAPERVVAALYKHGCTLADFNGPHHKARYTAAEGLFAEAARLSDGVDADWFGAAREGQIVCFGNIGHFHKDQDGSEALQMAIDLCLELLEHETLNMDDHVESNILLRLGNALKLKGERGGGPDGLRLLANAEMYLAQALRLLPASADILDIAPVKQAISEVFASRGFLTPDDSAGRHSLRAVETLEGLPEQLEALNSPEAQDLGEQLTRQMGMALGYCGLNAETEAAIRLYKRALFYQRKLISDAAQKDNLFLWANDLQNVAATLDHLARLSTGEEQQELFKTAFEHYARALKAFNQEDSPSNHANTHDNMARLFRNWGDTLSGAEAAAKYETALRHIDKALDYYDPEHSAHDYEHSKITEGKIVRALASLER